VQSSDVAFNEEQTSRNTLGPAEMEPWQNTTGIFFDLPACCVVIFILIMTFKNYRPSDHASSNASPRNLFLPS